MTQPLRVWVAACFFGMASLTATVAQVDGSTLQAPGRPESYPVPAKSNVSDELLWLEKNLSSSGRLRSAREGAPASYDLLQIYGNRVVVDVVSKEASTDALVAELQAKGMEVTGTYGRVISGFMPVSALSSLQTLAGMQYAAPAYKPFTNVGKVTSQGDTSMYSVLAREQFGVDGLGVKIGVLSDSYDNRRGAAASILNGELPGVGNPFGRTKPVQVLSDMTSGGSDEGRGMAELIHDVAPGSEMAFHTAFNGQADFARGIIKLAQSGCGVIVDDVIYFAEPMFQDGIIAQAVDSVKAMGVSYFSSAGNQARLSYESDYRPTGDNPRDPALGIAHNFSAYNYPALYYQPLSIPRGSRVIFAFQWDQPSFTASGVKAQTDMDIYIVNAAGQIVASGESNNILSGDPIEVFAYTNNTTNTAFSVFISNYAGPNPRRLKYIMYGNASFVASTPAVPGILSSTATGHCNAAGAIAVGAAPFYSTPAYGVNPPQIESFSSMGGCPVFFDKKGNYIGYVVRSKPEITATDGTNTSFFGGDTPRDTDTYPNFFGTSAAAPHAAAVAALMIEATKSPSGMSPDYVKGTLAYTAIDMDDPYTSGFQTGFDYVTGFGHVDALKAVQTVAVLPNYISNLGVIGTCSSSTDTLKNWKITNPNPFNVRVKWMVFGTTVMGELIAKPGDNMLATKGLAMQTLVISWKNAQGTEVKNTATSSDTPCSSAARSGIAADQSSQDFSIVSAYPNPTSGQLNILYTNGEAKALQVRLFNISGQQLYNRLHINQINNSEISVDASALPAGLYLLKVRQGQNEQTVKVVKQ